MATVAAETLETLVFARDFYEEIVTANRTEANRRILFLRHKGGCRRFRLQKRLSVSKQKKKYVDIKLDYKLCLCA